TIPKLPGQKEEFTKQELADFLNSKPATVATIIRRYGLNGTGNGKARRFSIDVAEAVRERLRKGNGPQTAAHYLAAIKAFTRWLMKDRRTPDNALAHLSVSAPAGDLRHDRRALTESEIPALLEATRTSNKEFRGITGAERLALYVTALSTGF